MKSTPVKFAYIRHFQRIAGVNTTKFEKKKNTKWFSLPSPSSMLKLLKLESLSKDVFEPRTSTGSEVFSLTTCLGAKKLVLIRFFSLIRTIYLRVSTKPTPNDANVPLPVDVRRSKTLLLKLLRPTELSDTYLCELTLDDAVGQKLSSIDKL